MKDDRKRTVCLNLRLTSEEYKCLCDRMATVGVTNREAFLRKMALDGIVVKLDVPELKEMISLLRYAGNNINQVAKRLHQTGRVYEADMADVKANQERLIGMANTIITKLAAIK